MIKYRLKCKSDHQFESWFDSSANYDRLYQAKMLTCAICGSAQVEKDLMAPHVSSKTSNGNETSAAEALRNAKDILKGAKNVGWQFAREARAIHYGDKEDQQIYGRAEPEDALELLKEGIKIAPLPFDPDAKEN